jgi:DNA-binding NtrC family response regulator
MAVDVLLAEDEEMVRNLAATALQRKRFLVIPARNPEESIEPFRSGINVDVLLTDMQMGNGITGIVLGEHLLNEQPGIAVLVMSGFLEAELLATEKNLAFLAKPFTPYKLVKTNATGT